MKLFFDGGCQPNPGEMEVAVVAGGIVYRKAALGFGTNNDAEWLACHYALEIAAMLGVRDVTLLGDSRLVVDQASGRAKCRGAALQRHHARFMMLAPGFERLRLRHISRTQNLAGIALKRL